MPDNPAPDRETEDFVRVTWYNLWSCFVRAEGCYVNDTMLMAKKMMTSTWSWDHCFNALAIVLLFHLDRKAGFCRKICKKIKPTGEIFPIGSLLFYFTSRNRLSITQSCSRVTGL